MDAATAGGAWDNAPVLAGAPHSATIGNYITPKNCLTVGLPSGDLCYIIKAGKIDDKALMAAASQEELVDFFIYAKEVNRIVADRRSAETGRLASIILANDLSKVDLLGDGSFRKALSASSKRAASLFPSLNGPTFILNLPFVANALVQLFKPLFPAKLQAKLKFEKGPLLDVDDLTTLHGASGARQQFLASIEPLLG